MSPDGRYVAWTVNLRNADNTQSRNSEIYLLDLSKPGATAQKISAAKTLHAEHGVAWSPDSKQFAFLSDAEKTGQLELYVQSPGGPARKLTSLTGFLDSPRWSPDGKKIALLFTENAPRAAGPLEPSTKESGVIEEHIYEQRLTLIDPASGKSNQLSPADTYVYEFDWSPDSTRLAYTAAQGNGDNNWWIAQLYTISASSGEVHPVYKTLMQLANPRFSPDGKEIAFIGGIMSDESSTGGDIYHDPRCPAASTRTTSHPRAGAPQPGCAGCPGHRQNPLQRNRRWRHRHRHTRSFHPCSRNPLDRRRNPPRRR